MNILVLAATFAARKHRNQRRKDLEASPYINHPLDLANVLCNEAGITDELVVVGAILHDTIEDTDTTAEEIKSRFGTTVMQFVLEVTDNKHLPKAQRKQLQIEHASHLSYGAKLIKLADKICNLRDLVNSPPPSWSIQRQVEYFDWAKAVVDGMRGTQPELEMLFDIEYAKKPVSHMDTKECVKVAIDTGFLLAHSRDEVYMCNAKDITRFTHAIQAAERERCAQRIELNTLPTPTCTHGQDDYNGAIKQFSGQIRGLI